MTPSRDENAFYVISRGMATGLAEKKEHGGGEREENYWFGSRALHSRRVGHTLLLLYTYAVSIKAPPATVRPAQRRRLTCFARHTWSRRQWTGDGITVDGFSCAGVGKKLAVPFAGRRELLLNYRRDVTLRNASVKHPPRVMCSCWTRAYLTDEQWREQEIVGRRRGRRWWRCKCCRWWWGRCGCRRRQENAQTKGIGRVDRHSGRSQPQAHVLFRLGFRFLVPGPHAD